MKRREHIWTATQIAALHSGYITNLRSLLFDELIVHVEIHGDGHEITKR